MAKLNTRMNIKNSSGTYDIHHIETNEDIVLCDSGVSTLKQKLSLISSDISNSTSSILDKESKIKTINVPNSTNLAEYFKTANRIGVHTVLANTGVTNTCIPNTSPSFYFFYQTHIIGLSETGNMYMANFLNSILGSWSKLIDDKNLNLILTENLNKIKGNAIYMSDFPSDTLDYSLVLNPLLNTTYDRVIVCEYNKEYHFRTPLTFKGRVKIVGNDSLWRYYGTGTFITFSDSAWAVEGSEIESLIFWCNDKIVGAYQDVTLFAIYNGHVNVAFRNLKIYNFGYCWQMGKPGGGFNYGHSIINCNAWGFITVINSEYNSEQVLVQHCWFDDGKRTSGSQNPCIRVLDATSFWIRDNIIQNCDIGVLLGGVRGGEIQGNHFENMIDSSISLNPSSVYENRNTNIIGNWLVGHLGCIRFFANGGRKSIHTNIFGNIFGFLGTNAVANITGATGSESNTQMINNSKIDGSRPWYPSTIVTLKEWQ